jgi:hypothetical protein
MVKDYIANVRVHKKDRDGNVYHDVQILDREGRIVCAGSKFYGYGSQYMQTVADLLDQYDMLVTLDEGEEDFNKWRLSQVVRHVIFIVHTY